MENPSLCQVISYLQVAATAHKMLVLICSICVPRFVQSSLLQPLSMEGCVPLFHVIYKKQNLCSPYTSATRVILPGPKTFQVDMGGRSETITVDSLKPAQVETETPLPGPSKPQKEHSKPNTRTSLFAKGSTAKPALVASSNCHNDTFQFWGEWCSGLNLEPHEHCVCRISIYTFYDFAMLYLIDFFEK